MLNLLVYRWARFTRVLAIGFAAAWVVCGIVAWWWLRAVAAAGWPTADGRLESVQQIFRDQEPDAAALELELAGRELGVELIRRRGGQFDPGRSGEAGAAIGARRAEPAAHLKSIEEALKAYIEAQLETPTPSVAAPTPPVAAFLSAHLAALDRVVALLTEAQPPRWPVDTRLRYGSRDPNYLGHIRLARLLTARALEQGARGDAGRAWETLRAVSALTDSLDACPLVVSRLISLVEASFVIGTMRKLPGAVPAWAHRWPERDPRAAMTASLVFFAWTFHWPFVEPLGTDFLSNLDHEPPEVATRSRRGLMMLLDPYMRLGGADLARAHRSALAQVTARSDCSDGPILSLREVRIPRWNIIGRAAFTEDLHDLSWRRVAQILAHLQGTRLILAARAARQRTGSWPAAVELDSYPCDPGLWSYSRGADGGVTLRSRAGLLPINESITLMLPLEYSSR